MENRKIFIEYIKFNCRNFFITYPEDIVPELFDHFSVIQDFLIEDIVFWYTRYRNILSRQNYFRHLQLNPNWEAIFYYRLSRRAFLENPHNEMLPFLASLMKYKSSAELYYSTNIGRRFMLMHGSGVVVGPNCSVGDECVIYQGVTIGQQHTSSPDENATIGSNVKIFAGAKILGKVSIGDDVIIGANAVVTKDIPSNGVYVGVPARKIKTKIKSAD